MTRTRSRIFLAIAASFAVLFWCAAAEADFFSPGTLQRFAPLLVIQKEEDNGPASAQWFLDRSALTFSESDPCSNETIYSGPWTREASARLGLLVSPKSRWQYRDKLFPLCHHTGQTLIATEDTRPFDSHQVDGINPGEGFFLDFRGTDAGEAFSKGGTDREFKTSAPIYYDDGPLFGGKGKPRQSQWAYITYWFFYAFNDAPHVHSFFNHQGDWENMSLLFERPAGSTAGPWLLKQVAYASHGTLKARPAACPSDVYATEPLKCHVPRALWHGSPRLVGFVANGDHATYSSPGGHPLLGGLAEDRTSALGTGFSWPTWNALQPLQSQPWAGFCGAWGHPGPALLGLKVPLPEDGTGPLGPGCLDEREQPLKTGRPDQWGRSKSSPGDRESKPGKAIGAGL
jgi:hypothetical protein